MRTAHRINGIGQTVGEIMRAPVTAEPAEPIRAAAARMKDAGAGAAAVLDGGRLVGILTERDLLRAIVDGLDPLASRVTQVMTAEPVTIEPGVSISEAASLMVKLAVRHLPVVHDGHLDGMVSARDIVTSGARYAASLAYEPW
jgi:CBS domain-containing protein